MSDLASKWSTKAKFEFHSQQKVVKGITFLFGELYIFLLDCEVTIFIGQKMANEQQFHVVQTNIMKAYELLPTLWENISKGKRGSSYITKLHYNVVHLKL